MSNSDEFPQMNPEEIEQLLLEAIPAITTAVSVVSAKEFDGVKHDRKLVGYVEIDEHTEWATRIMERWDAAFEAKVEGQEFFSFDLSTRWNLIAENEQSKRAHIVLEALEGDFEDPDFRGVIVFEYPKDRDCLIIAATTGRLLVRAGRGNENAIRRLPNQEVEGAVHELMYEQYNSYARNVQLVEISTGPLLQEMIGIMDDRNPNMPKRTVKQIMNHLDIAQVDAATLTPPSSDWWNFWDKLEGDEEGGRLHTLLARSKDPLGDTLSIFTAVAIRSVLSKTDPQTAEELSRLVDLDAKALDKFLWNIFQHDESWVFGRQRGDGEFEWMLYPTALDEGVRDDFAGYDLMNSSGRLQAAYELLESLKIEIPIEHKSPALQLMNSIMDFEQAATMVKSLIHAKTPVWAGAKGFARIYDECTLRARLMKDVPFSETSGVDRLHIQSGHSLAVAHVITLGSRQVVALPQMYPEDASEFIRTTRLPFDPLFLDFTADDGMPSIESELSETGRVRIIGSLINTSPINHDVLFITPIFFYGNPEIPLTPIALGSLGVNRSGNPGLKFEYVMGSEHRFVPDGNKRMLVLVADSPVLNKARNRHMMHEYETLIWEASKRTISALYFFEAANIEIVPAPLERRLKKRQEKRGWLIPLTIRVDRPAKRVIARNGNAEAVEVDWQYQWEVVGCYHHITKGNAVRCTVCEGKTTEDLICPRCNGTGLDPDKVKPCSRIDIATGQKTCPHGCRRIWHKEHVKGPEDRPLVIKTRKVR